ncbi:MAG TPA: protein kinase [Polyangiaceae bacterium]|nr:protein kinase [Polyangiaceae bacterium]
MSSEQGLPKLLGRYQIERLIGQGAMGRVLLAHDPVLHRSVAVKHLRDDLKLPPEVREGLLVRMRHEARAAARVMHPHLVTLHDMGEDNDLGLYLVFEYCEGPTLKQRIFDGPLTRSQAGRLARELGAALAVAHSAGIVHRDIKPENIILSPIGGKIADFGIARIPDSTLTHAGGLMGTPAYSAPETFQAGAFSPESDQFSLAASMYEALSAERAFPGDDAIAVAARIGSEPPKPFPPALGIPAGAYDVLARGMAKKPSERFASCEEFGLALEKALSDREPAERRGSQPSLSAIDGAKAEAPIRSLDALPDARDLDDLPRERKLGHILLGVAAVGITAVLLIRAALQEAERPAPDETAPAASTSAKGANSAWTRTKVAPSRTAAPKPAHTGEGPGKSSTPSPEPGGGTAAQPSGLDAGVDGSAGGGGEAPGSTGGGQPATTAPTSSGSPAPPAGAKDGGG